MPALRQLRFAQMLWQSLHFGEICFRTLQHLPSLVQAQFVLNRRVQCQFGTRQTILRGFDLRS